MSMNSEIDLFDNNVMNAFTLNCIQLRIELYFTEFDKLCVTVKLP